MATSSWSDFKVLFNSVFGFNFNSIEDVVNYIANKNISCAWHKLNNWELLEDKEIIQKLSCLRNFSGELFIITEASYEYGPFKSSSELIDKLVNEHLNDFGECFFNGDVIIFNPVNKTIWLFHHEGVYTVLEL